jgi:two-component system CheB/CheR fusion protein
MQLHPEIYLDHVVDEDRHIAKRIIKYLRKTHESFDETICIQCDNSIRLIKVQGFLVQDDAGHPWKLVGVDLDMTSIREAEKQLQESQRMLQQTSEASPDAIVIFHLKTRQSTYLNQRLAEWLEMSNDALLQMGMEGRLMLIHPDDRLKLLHFNEKLVAAKGHEVLTLDYRVRTNSGKVVWVRNRGRVLRRNKEGVVTDLLSILQDVTDEKMAELKLQQLNQSLHQKNKDLESKNEEITSFAFVGSHDLKEPLRKLHILSDWLLLKESAHLSPKGVEYLQRIAEMVKRLEALLNDLLILTQMNAADDVHAFVSLDKVAEKALQELAKEVEQSGAVIKKDNLGSLQGQENQLLHLFKNLISNAIKFQRKGNIPELTLHADILPGHAIADQQADPEITYQRICFTDNGIGVSQQYEKKIFAVFRRLHSKEEYPGMGMGLAICKKVMEKHGGFITVESHSGKGSTFCCYFPYMAG